MRSKCHTESCFLGENKMKRPYEIIAEVFDAYRGLPVKLSRMNGKSEQWYRSHGYEPRTDNPTSNGNKSEVEGFVAQCEQYEAAMPGAGRMLIDRIHAEVNLRFTEAELTDITQKELNGELLKESFDVLDCFNKYDFKSVTTGELASFEDEVSQLRDKADEVFARLRSIKIQKQSERNRANGRQ
jgi:hypothetical protein